MMYLAATMASNQQLFLLIPYFPENNQVYCDLEMH